jgi:hypothetical protein
MLDSMWATEDDAWRRFAAVQRPGASCRASHKLGGRRLERLDFAAAICAAGRADVMGPLRPVALRALDDGRDRELVRGPALVAARLGGFSFGDSHRAVEYS